MASTSEMPPALPSQVKTSEEILHRMSKFEAVQEMRHKQLLQKIDEQTAMFKSMLMQITKTLLYSNESSNVDDGANKHRTGRETNRYTDENSIPSNLDVPAGRLVRARLSASSCYHSKRS